MTMKSKTQRLQRKFSQKAQKKVDTSLKDKSNKNNLLIQFFLALEEVTSFDSLVEVATKYCLDIFHMDGASIYLPDPSNKYLIPIKTKIKTAKLARQIGKITQIKKIPLNSDMSPAKAFSTQKFIITKLKSSSVIKKTGFSFVFSFPMVVKGKSFGVLVMGSCCDDEVSDQTTETARLVSVHLGLKLEHIQLLEDTKSKNHQLEVMQNNIHEGLSIHGADGSIRYANKMVGKFFGTTRNTVGIKREELATNWTKYHRYKLERLYDRDQMEKAVTVEKKPFLNGLMKIYSNPVRYVSSSYFPIIENGEYSGMAAVYRDVTNEKKQEEEIDSQLQFLRTEKDRWKAIIQNIDEGVYLLDKDLKITHMNARCEILSGWTFEEAVGKPVHEVFQCHTVEGLYYPDFNPLQKIFFTGEGIPYDEHLHTTKTGEDYWVGVSASPIRNAEGSIEEIVTVIRDMNSFKEIEKAKSEFVSIASHELRTPLTVINGYLSLLLSGDIGNFESDISRANLKQVLQKVFNETNRLTKLVSDLLNVSRIEEKRIRLYKKNYCINDVITEVVEQMQFTALSKNIDIVFNSSNISNSNLISFDKDKICQVIINLVDNAIKFTHEGGKVFVDSQQIENSVFVSIKDTGIGIPKKLLPVVFDKFQQVSGSYLKENRGTGLGLYVVKSLVELHDGRVIVDSIPGKGSNFTFILPANIA